MKIRGALTAIAGRFDRLSLRERVLTSAAVLAVLIALFDALVLQRLEMRKQQLAEQLTQIVATIDATAVATGEGSDAAGATVQHTAALAAQLSQATARLDSRSAGLIPPQRMTQVIHDVLSQQHGVTLVSLRSLTPYALIDGAPGDGAAGGNGSAGQPPAADPTASPSVAATVTAASQGPYVHSVELVLQGHYLDVLAYLKALEGLRWHFYWQSVALDATDYPTTRATVKLGTVSMSREWIDL